MRWGQFTAGFAFTFLVPEFGDNIAFTTTSSDGASFENVSPTQFNYGLKVAPRIWLEYTLADGLGARASYWQFNHAAATAIGTAPANGFGQITTPTFGDIDISTIIPGSTMTANSGLELQALDLEGTKGVSFGRWSLAASAGVRYGAIKQNYSAQQRSANGVLNGSIDFQHNFEGAGPTFGLEARRYLAERFSIFSTARGSLLFGNLRSTLQGGEDLDLSTPFITSSNNRRLDTLPVANMQLGADWQIPLGTAATFFWQGAMEAQWWQGVGSAATETGDLGLFGFNTAVGIAW